MLTPSRTLNGSLPAKSSYSNFARVVFCIGKQSEVLHDILDDWLIEKDLLGTMTTWDEDGAEGVWFASYISQLKKLTLVAPLADHAALAALFRHQMNHPSAE